MYLLMFLLSAYTCCFRLHCRCFRRLPTEGVKLPRRYRSLADHFRSFSGSVLRKIHRQSLGCSVVVENVTSPVANFNEASGFASFTVILFTHTDTPF